MSKKCVSCGVELEDDAAFCDECGAPQTPLQPQAESKKNPSKEIPVKKEKSIEEERLEEKDNPEKRKLGMSIASLVMGIIAVCTFGLFFIPEILGLTFGIISLANKQKKSVMAIIGIILSVLSVILLILI